MGDVTRLLARWSGGDAAALAELMPLVYSELHKLARHYLRQERLGHTLQPTALVHEAYLRLIDVRAADFASRVQFYGAAAQVMRRVLVDHARRRHAGKRHHQRSDFDVNQLVDGGIDHPLTVLILDEALERLADIAPQPAKVVELRCFGGLSVVETAGFLGIAPATVKRHWSFARAWLHGALSGDAAGSKKE